MGRDYRNLPGELNELDYHLHLTGRLGNIAPDGQAGLEALRVEAARWLDGLLKMLDKQIIAG